MRAYSTPLDSPVLATTTALYRASPNPFNLMTRSKRITYANLQQRDPELVKQVTEVFAEVGGGTDDIADDAFEVIAALPSDLAQAMLTAMTESGNEPIGVRRDLRSDRELLDANGASQTSSGNAAQKPVDPTGVPGAPTGRKISPLMIFFGFVCLMLIARAIKRSGGGR